MRHHRNCHESVVVKFIKTLCSGRIALHSLTGAVGQSAASAMTNTNLRRAGTTGLLLAIVTGCSSVAVKNDDLEQRTGFALGLEPREFSISNREDNGMRTDYTVRTRSGADYRCYVEGTVSITGRIVSDAICSKSGGGVGARESTQSGTCNALLKAAGKC